MMRKYQKTNTKRNEQMIEELKDGMTLAEAGKKYNLTRQRVHQIKVKQTGVVEPEEVKVNHKAK